MNELFIPPSPNWYQFNAVDCAPDNTVVYLNRMDIFIINPRDISEAANIQRIVHAHNDKVTGVSLNHATWADPDKFAASIGEDYAVRLWDLNTLEVKKCHRKHDPNDSLVGVSLLGDRVVSVSEKGVIIVWKLSKNHCTTFKDLFKPKSKVRCMISCPHAVWNAAFGFAGGNIAIVDLRSGKVLRRMKSNEHDITGMSWCPVPLNIYKTKVGIEVDNIVRNRIVSKKTEDTDSLAEISDKIASKENAQAVEQKLFELQLSDSEETEADELEVDIPKYDLENREPQTYKKSGKNPWADLNFEDSKPANEIGKTTNSDFLEECLALKNKLEFKDDEEILENIPQIDSDSLVTSANRFISNDSEKEYLLATVGKDGLVHIWRALTDGKLQISFSPPGKKQKKKGDTFIYRNKWFAVCWAKPDILLVSSVLNRVYCWNLLPDIDPENPPQKQKILEPRLVHQDHNSQIFTITIPYKIYSAVERIKSWSCLDDFFIWTSAKDKWLLCTTIGTRRKTLASYPCFGAGINGMSVSPIDPSKIAISLHDNSVRIWDLSIPHTQVITMSKLTDSQHDKMSCVAWHPVKENCLAYATTDGKVAQFMTNNKTREVFSHYHGIDVYKVQWAPFPEKEGEYGLYSCSFNELVYHDGSDLSADPIRIELDEHHPTIFSWKPDYSTLAVGTKEGSVKLLSRNFKEYETLFFPKAVQCVEWHSECTISDQKTSPYSNYLAIATNGMNVNVYKISSEESNEKSEIIATLEGHNTCVKSLCWCPQIGGRLVSGSEDNVAMVWDVITQTLLSTYKSNGMDTLGAICWSPLDADLIILGGRDHTFRVFRITKHPPVIFKAEKKKSLKKVAPETVEILDYDYTESIVSSIQEKKKQYVLPVTSKLQHNQEADKETEICRKVLQIFDEKKEDEEEEEDNASGIDVSQLFGTRKDMMDLVNFEQKSHITKRHWTDAHHLSLWKGDLAETVEKSLKSGVIDPWIITMAPMVSHELWRKLCLQYAESLSEEGRGLEACSYFLACHQVQKAIDALRSSNLFKEALALAKLRLPSDDPIISNIFKQWATYANLNGSYEIAAQCYIILGQFSEAGVLLNKRTEPEKLQLALELAKRSDNHDLEVAVNAKLELINQQTKEQSESSSEPEVVNILSSRFSAMMKALNKDDDQSEKKEDPFY